jgi:cytochrome c-type biogenesis protein CcmH/NrfG
MIDNRSQLLTRKRDLIAALRTLEHDFREGTLDAAAYQSARQRYEQEAAAVLERLDALPVLPGEIERGERLPRATPSGQPRRWMLIVGIAFAAVAVALFLLDALQHRGSGAAVTGSVPPTVALPPEQSAAILAAQRQVEKHPRSANAYIALGNAEYGAGQLQSADTAYQQAMRLAPNDPQPATLHAMLMGSAGQRQQGLALLQRVERQHPGYSHAWLVDGLLRSSDARQRKQAIAAWRHFLRLDPRGPMSADVRTWIKREQAR